MKQLFYIFLYFMFDLSTMLMAQRISLLSESDSGLRDGCYFYSGSGTPLQRDEIKKNWDNNKYIVSADYTAVGWFVYMANLPGITNQSYSYDKNWPKEWLDEKINKGYYITSVSVSKSKWFIVVSEGCGFTSQIWKYTSDTRELDKWYKEYRDKGYRLTTAEYDYSGSWLWVMSKDSKISSQGYLWANESNIKQKISNEIWDKNYVVHGIYSYSNGYLIFFGNYKNRNPRQSWKTGSNELKGWINDEWNESRSIVSVSGYNEQPSESIGNTPKQNNNYNDDYNYPSYGTIPSGINYFYFSDDNESMMVMMTISNYLGNMISINVTSFFGDLFITVGNDVVQQDDQYFYFLPQSMGYLNGQIRVGGSAVVSKDWERLTITQMTGAKMYFTKSVSAEKYRQFIERLSNDPDARRRRRENWEYNRQNPDRKKQSSSVCSRCNGTGVDPTRSSTRAAHYTWNKYYNSSGIRCPYCGFYDEHWHYRCSSCNVPKY